MRSICAQCAPVFVLSVVGGCSRGGADTVSSVPATAQAAPVTVATVEARDVPVQLRQIARVEPYTMVTVRSRVAGELQKVHIVPGQEVKTGDLLYEIDPRPFDAALHEAQARLDRDRALANNAQIDATRVAGVYATGAATREEADKSKFDAEAAQAVVRADEATVENAKLQILYTQIRSPVDGRAGSLLADAGNMIKADDTTLLTINQFRPIYVTFQVPEVDLPEVRKQMQQGQPVVDVSVPPATTPLASGKLTFIDNQVDIDTGTLRLKATFDNADAQLWPGQFVTAVLKLSVDKNAIVVPSRAVQNGQQGTFVYVVKDDQSVELRQVTVRRTTGEDSVIEPGSVQAGQRVVTDGHLRLVNGANVQVKAALAQPATKPSSAGEVRS